VQDRYKIISNSIFHWLPLVLLLIISLIQSFNFSIHDFANYYYGAKALKDGLFNQSIYNALVFNELILNIYDHRIFAAYYPNPPTLSWLYMPFTFLDWKGAKIVVNILSILLFVLSLIKLQKHWKNPSYFLLLILFIFYPAIKNNILFGQTYLLLFALLLLGFILISQYKNSSGALLWILAILLKSSPIILLGYLFFTKNSKVFFSAVVILITTVVLSTFFIKSTVWQYYFYDVFLHASKGNIYNGFAIGAKSFEMLFKNLFVKDVLLNPSPLFESQLAFDFCKYGLKFMALGSTIFVSIHKAIEKDKKFGLWILTLLLLSPTLSSYAMILLIIPLTIFFNDSSKLSLLVMIGLLILINYYPGYWFYDKSLFLSFGKAYALLSFFFFYLYLVMKKYWSRRTNFQILGSISVFSFCFFVYQFNFSQSKRITKASYALDKEEHILLKDFYLEDQTLYTTYWTLNGDLQTQHTLPFKVRNSKPGTVRQRDNHPIKKSILVNDSLLYYMTDENRSTGFYTLKREVK